MHGAGNGGQGLGRREIPGDPSYLEQCRGWGRREPQGDVTGRSGVMVPERPLGGWDLQAGTSKMTSSQLAKNEWRDKCFRQEHAWHIRKLGWEGGDQLGVGGERRAGSRQARGAPGRSTEGRPIFVPRAADGSGFSAQSDRVLGRGALEERSQGARWTPSERGPWWGERTEGSFIQSRTRLSRWH